MRPRATQAEVARLAGVSQATVSHVINGSSNPRNRVSDAVRRRVLDAMESVGYVANPLARGLAGGQNRLVGVFTYEPVFPRDGSDFYHPFLQGIEAQAEASGLDLLLFTSAPSDHGRRRLSDAGWNRIALADGCILIGRLTDRNEVAWLLERRYPFVFLGRRETVANQEVPFVGADYVAATADLTRRMLAVGHRRIAFVGDLGGAISAGDRVAGYRQAMLDAGQRPLLFDSGAFSADETVQIIRDHRATAALFGGQVDAAAIEAAAGRAGMAIPTDLSVARMGDPERYAPDGTPLDPDPTAGRAALDWSRFTIPRAEMGEAAVRMLAQLLEPATPDPRPELLGCTQVPGRTIDPPRADRPGQ